MQACVRVVEKKPLPYMLAVTNMLLHGTKAPLSCATTTRSPARMSPGGSVRGTWLERGSAPA